MKYLLDLACTKYNVFCDNSNIFSIKSISMLFLNISYCFRYIIPDNNSYVTTLIISNAWVNKFHVADNGHTRDTT